MLKNKAPVDGAEGDGHFVIAGDTLTLLQAVDRTTTDVFLQLARLRSGASLASKGFRTTARVVTGHPYAAQLKAERVAELVVSLPFHVGLKRTRLHKSTPRRSFWLTHTYLAP